MAAYNAQQVEAAYAHCQSLVRGHYENFPVASLILPKRLRRPISVIYAFARTADDFADEGHWDAETRLTKLQQFDAALQAIEAGHPPDDPIFIALADVIAHHQLPMALFHDLLTAFRLDVGNKRYADFDAVLGYCRYSANPVGRLLLHLTGAATEENVRHSDAICSALQLINFLQDIEQDYTENDRIYLPLDEMERFGVGETHIRERHSDESMRALIHHQIQRARAMMLSGLPLGSAIPGRFGFQLRLMINSGLRVLELLNRQHNDLFSRPRLQPRDWFWVLWRALRM